MTEGLHIFKFGRETVTDQDGVSHERIERYAYDISKIPKVIVTTSGAKSAGEAIWRQSAQYKAGKKANDKSLVTLGSPELYKAWQKALQGHGRLSGEVPVTHREIEDIEEGPSFQALLHDNLELDIISLINESPLSEEELARLAYGGDNDGLSSHTARIMRASVLGLMTKKDGLLDTEGRVVEEVPYDAEAHHQAMVFAGELNEHKQGMPTKVWSAIEATHAGVDVYIARAGVDIGRMLAGQEISTHLVAGPKDM